jgi:hypothetical protein
VIDFDRFWAEPGIPGMTGEEAEAQLRQMGAWLESLPGASGKFDMSQVPGMTTRPGVTDEQIADWEKTHRVRRRRASSHPLQSLNANPDVHKMHFTYRPCFIAPWPRRRAY